MKPFYVYQLVDPRTDAPFYIGKGQKSRAWSHLRGKSHNPAVNERTAELASVGEEVRVEIVRRFDTDSEAIDFEATLICATEGLVNVLARGWKLTPEQERLSAMARKEKEFARLGMTKMAWCKKVLAHYSRPNIRFAWNHPDFDKVLDPQETCEMILEVLRGYVARWEKMGITGA